MTQEEAKELTIFLSDKGAFISKQCLYDEPATYKRELTDAECLSFVTWFFTEKFKGSKEKELTLSMCGLPTFKVTDIRNTGTSKDIDKFIEGLPKPHSENKEGK